MQTNLDGRLDEDLLAAARRGDERAFSELYRRHRNRAMDTARRALARPCAATTEDVVHAAFLAVWRTLRNGAGPTQDLGPYLTVAVRRLAWRAQRTDREVRLAVDRVAEDLRPSAGEGHALVREALAALSPSQRQILWMIDVEGRRVSDVAAALGMAPASVSSARYRARRSLVRSYVAACKARAPKGCGRSLDELASRLLVARTSSPDDLPGGDAPHAACRWCRDAARGVDLILGDHR